MSSLPPRAVPRRSRVVYAGLAVATIGVGLASRRLGDGSPDWIRLYVGDMLWAAMVYFLAAAVWRTASISRLAIGSIAFAVAVELSQLYHAPWLDGIRATRVGGLVLGFGFLWSDIVCYALGVAIAAVIDDVSS